MFGNIKDTYITSTCKWNKKGIKHILAYFNMSVTIKSTDFVFSLYYTPVALKTEPLDITQYNEVSC